jgi:hypothetical protein
LSIEQLHITLINLGIFCLHEACEIEITLAESEIKLFSDAKNTNIISTNTSFLPDFSYCSFFNGFSLVDKATWELPQIHQSLVIFFNQQDFLLARGYNYTTNS